MLKIDNNELRAEIADLVQQHGKERQFLLPILHDLQNKYHGINADMMQIVADELGIHAVEVQEVVTFYHFYNIEEKGKYIIRMCETMPCKMQQAVDVAKAFEEQLGIKFGETTKDGLFSLEWTSCIGLCDQAPAILVNYQPYPKVTVDQVAEIIKTCKEGA